MQKPLITNLKKKKKKKQGNKSANTTFEEKSKNKYHRMSDMHWYIVRMSKWYTFNRNCTVHERHGVISVANLKDKGRLLHKL